MSNQTFGNEGASGVTDSGFWGGKWALPHRHCKLNSQFMGHGGQVEGKECPPPWLRHRWVWTYLYLSHKYLIIIGLLFFFHFRTSGKDGKLQGYGDGIWNNIRLPQTLLPLKYNVHIRTDLTNFTFNGTIEIYIQCTENTDVLLLHSTQLEVPLETITVHPEKSRHEDDRIHFKRYPWFHEDNQFLVVELKKSMKAGDVYRFSAMFSAPLLHDYNAGYYRTPYETATGEER